MIVLPNKPGLYPGIPFEDYLRWPFMSQSILKAGCGDDGTMSKLRAALDGMRTVKATDDMLLGAALHTAFLEPELVPTRVVKWDGPRRAGKEWEEFKDEHAGKVILTAGMYDKLVGMVRSLRKHPEVRKWQSRLEEVELSALGEIHGVMFKGRCDALTPDPLVDLKKVQSTSIRSATNTIMAFGYHRQGAIYRRLFKRDRFMLIMVEDTPPYDVVPFELSPALLRKGDEEVSDALAQYRFCVERGVWPGRSDEVIQIELPEWAITDDEASAITIDGQPSFTESTNG